MLMNMYGTGGLMMQILMHQHLILDLKPLLVVAVSKEVVLIM